METIDLTPFGFTPTENRAYLALLEFGPSTGYQLAKKLTIARANAYQALNGLVAKAAAVTTGERPQRYRPLRPDALLAHLVDAAGNRIDRLEAQIRSVARPEGDAVVRVSGRRALVDLATRTAGREEAPLICIGPATLLSAVGPAWRRRKVAGWTTALWPVGDETPPLALPPAGMIATAAIEEVFGTVAFLLVATTAIVARVGPDDAGGHWMSEATLVNTVRACARHLTT